ncbi:hypothetical protein ACI2U6_24015 [Ralstonia nicotianae]
MMVESITVTARRTYWNTVVAVAGIWLTPSGCIVLLSLAGLFVFDVYDATSPWLTVLGALGCFAVVLLMLLALQVWRIIRSTKAVGEIVYTFDAAGAACRNGALVTHVPWSGVHHVKVTGSAVLVYVTARAVWFFQRGDLTRSEQRTIMSFARRANVKLIGQSDWV